MKNTIPLIIAVIFGLAAVLAVSRTLNQKENARGQTVEVLKASRTLKAGDTLGANDYVKHNIPADVYIAGQQVRYEDRNMVEGLKLNHAVMQRSFIMMSDFEVADSPSADVGLGEWAVPVHFADGALLNYIQRGDEIAIILWVKVQKEEAASRDLSAGSKIVEQQEARVLFPRKRVMNKMQNGVVLSLPPKEAMTLRGAQRAGELYPVLRRRGDSGSNLEITSLQAGDALTMDALEKMNREAIGE
jgi:Flp pilus assembly protein CpaB